MPYGRSHSKKWAFTRSSRFHIIRMAVLGSDQAEAMTSFCYNVSETSSNALLPSRALAVLADPENAWSKANAIQLLALLPNVRAASTKTYPQGAPSNDRQSALKNFLALYDITQEGKTGSRDALRAQIHSVGNKDKIIEALFGDGTKTGGLVSQAEYMGSDSVRLD